MSYYWICPSCGCNNMPFDTCKCGNNTYSVYDMFPFISVKEQLNKKFGNPKGVITMKIGLSPQAVKFIEAVDTKKITIYEMGKIAEVAAILYPVEEGQKITEYCIKDVEMTQKVYEATHKVEDLFGPRLFKNSVAIIRTKKGNTVGCHMFSTYNYRKLRPRQFVYNEYCGKSFEITESVGGQVVILINDQLPYSNLTFTNTVRIDNVIGIEIMSEHDQ